jgi:hypothetical protein
MMGIISNQAKKVSDNSKKEKKEKREKRTPPPRSEVPRRGSLS